MGIGTKIFKLKNGVIGHQEKIKANIECTLFLLSTKLKSDENYITMKELDNEKQKLLISSINEDGWEIEEKLKKLNSYKIRLMNYRKK